MTTTPKTRRLRTAGITSIAVVSLAAGGLVAQSAGAADSSGSSTSSAKTATPPKPPTPGQEDARLAKGLGVSQEKVEAARKAVRASELDAAVKAGRITTKQQVLVEQLRETGLDVPLPPGKGGGPGSGTDPETALAKELGVSVSKLHDARPAPPKGRPAGGPGQGGPGAGGPGGKGAPTPPKPGSGDAPKPPSDSGNAPKPGGTGTTGTTPTPPSGSTN